MSAVDVRSPFSAFAVGRRDGGGLAEMVQKLGTRLTDHRGLIELPALMVLFDDIGGLPFFFAGEGSSLQSRLMISALGRPGVDEELDATAELTIDDGDYGVTSVRITGRGGRPLVAGTARNVRVGRALVDANTEHLSIGEPVAADEQPAVARPAADLSGREVIDRIIDGALPIGPIAELLGIGLDFDDDALVVTAPAEEWMGNIMGTMHGGMIAAIVAQGISFGAQAATRPGGDYQLSDLAIAFLRSPAVDGRTLTMRIEPVKLGRRLSTFDTQLFDGETLLAHATADVRFDV